MNRVIQGVLATEFRQQLEHVYSVSSNARSHSKQFLRFQVCCHELRNENDELWLYGFSRGACRSHDNGMRQIGANLSADLVRALAAYFQSHPYVPTP